MEKYTLTHIFAHPPNIPKGEAEVVYMCLEANDSNPKTFQELIVEAKKRKLDAHFKTADSTTIADCLKYHLARFKKWGWVHISDK